MLRFKQLWDNYPTIQGEKAPCRTGGKKNFDDQCAIRVGSSLASCGVDTLTLVRKQRHCWHHKPSLGHVLAAEELAHGLSKKKITGIGAMKKVDPAEFPSLLTGKTGVIFFKDFWARTGESFAQRSGDHIDLWRKSRLTDWRTWFMISRMLNSSGNYSNSKEVWFWEVQ